MSLIGARVSMMAGKRLPYDAEVEYIESTGTQYIDTGVVASSAYKVEIRFTPYAYNGYATIIGARNGSDNNGGFQIRCGTNTSSGRRIFNGSTNSTTIPFTFDSENTVQVVLGSRDVVVNGASIRLSSAKTVTCGLTLPVFCLYKAQGTIDGVTYSNCRLYSLQIYSSVSTLVRNFQPVRVGSGANAVGCLYDKLGVGGMNPDGTARNDGIYFNRGTGAFGIGPDKN